MKQDHVLHDGDYKLIIREDRAAHLEAAEDMILEDSRLTILLSGADGLSAGIRKLEPVVQDQRTKVYVEQLESVVGTLEFTVDRHDGKLGVHAIAVDRRKLAHADELQELEATRATLKLPVAGHLKRDVVGTSAISGSSRDAKQWATSFRRALKPLRNQARAIRRHPRHAMEVRDAVTHVGQARQAPLVALQAAHRGQRLVQTPSPRWGVDSAARSMARNSAAGIQRVVRELIDDLDAAALLSDDLQRDLRELRKDLQSLQPSSKKPKLRQAVLHDPRYRGLHRAARLARRGRSTKDGRVAAQRPPTSDLYETWCARALIEELAAPENRQAALRQLFESPGNKVEITTDYGTATVSIQYEIKPSTADAIRSPAPRPDFVIEVQQEGRAFIFDAKYRAAGSVLDRPPMDTVDDLHAYRDLFLLHRDLGHRNVWCAVLYPGPGISEADWTPERFLNTAVRKDARIGAIPIRPHLREPLRDYLVHVGLVSAARLSAESAGLGSSSDTEIDALDPPEP